MSPPPSPSAPPSKELVLAIPTATLFAARKFQGLEAGGAEFLRLIFSPELTRYIPRSSAENDPAWKQIIPYVALHCDGAVLVYRRGKGSTESRLVAQHAIGVGGHIKHTDETFFAGAGFDAYQAALRREVQEEVAVEAGNIRRERLVGVINDDALPVGQVHVGVVHIWDLRAPQAGKREAKIANPHFVAVRELQQEPRFSTLETWSQFCVANWASLNAQTGWIGEP